MKNKSIWKSEAIIASLLSGLLSCLGAIIASIINGTSIKIFFTLNYWPLIIIFALIGAFIGLLVGRFVWKIKERTPTILKKRFMKSKKRIKSEVYMIELLQKPITIQKDQNKDFMIKIDTDGVEEIIISNKGKEEIIRKYVTPYLDDRKNQDIQLQKFLSGNHTERNKETIDLNKDFRLRWASGGVFSIIKYDYNFWIPLFFRDIKPYGWNISLGASERQFNTRNRTISDIYKELNDPEKFISREFLEETLLLKGDAKAGNFKKYDLFIDDLPPQKFISEHENLRKDLDHIEIDENTIPLTVNSIPSNTALKITKNEKTIGRVKDTLVCFSLLDLGIEVIKLFKYEMKEPFTLLDGEVIENFDGDKSTKELTRMPVALMSCDFLKQVFSKDITNFDYTLGPSPSVLINDKIPENKIKIFKWDVEKRLEIIKSKDGSIAEKERYLQWYDKFKDNFLVVDGEISTKNPSKLFTPATAKMLNLFFKNIDQKKWKW